MGRNYLKRSARGANNALLAGMEFNLMPLLRELVGDFLVAMFRAFLSESYVLLRCVVKMLYNVIVDCL